MKTTAALNTTELFNGLDNAQIEAMLPCLGMRQMSYDAGDEIIAVGTRLSEVGILTEGSANIVSTNAQGETEILMELKPGDLFGEEYICAGVPDSPVAVISKNETTVLFLHFNHLLTGCANACTFHSTAIQNLIKILAKRTIRLNQKIEVLSKRTTREKLLVYLQMLQHEQRREIIEVPINRGQLADYLSVDRSAMSREIGKLCGEGVIECDHNRFRIL